MLFDVRVDFSFYFENILNSIQGFVLAASIYRQGRGRGMNPFLRRPDTISPLKLPARDCAPVCGPCLTYSSAALQMVNVQINAHICVHNVCTIFAQVDEEMQAKRKMYMR